MKYTIENISKILKGTFLNSTVYPLTIQHILFDSRKVIFPNQAIFFAIIGKRQDGHDFLKDAYQKGLRNFVISRSVLSSDFPDANLILVKNTSKALQQLATYHRQQFDLKTIAITGSNGKTIIKEWLFQLLHQDYNIVRSPKSYNSQIGVPLSVLLIQKQHNLGIFEAGISKIDEMQNVAPIIDTEIGIFTNIGTAHSEGFPSIQRKIQEKIQLFKNCKTIIYNKDDERVHQAMQQLRGKTFFTWSMTQAADLQILNIIKEEGKTIIKGKFSNCYINAKLGLNYSSVLIRSIIIPFTDSASIENAIHCWATMLYLGIPQATIKQRMQALEPVAMRLELKAGINNCTIVNDSYNADLKALEIALNFLEQQSRQQQGTLILSDILQSGQSLSELYKNVAQLILAKNIHRLIGIGTAIQQLKQTLPNNFEAHFFETTDDFLNQYPLQDFQQEAILLKGARPFAFERIAEQLAQKVHNTILEVNLDSVVHNLAVFHQYLKPTTKIMAMVKASAYGSGSLEVARLLAFHNVDYLAVAYADEGVELRRNGIQIPILFLNPEPATFDTLFRYNLEPEIYNFHLLKQFIQYLPTDQTDIPIHLKIDTGMHRLGFELEEIPALLELLRSEPRLKVQSIFSHLAGSEDTEHDDFTQEQIQKYMLAYEQLAEGLGYLPIRHILNSGGIVRFPQHQMDMVRLGIGLYGIDGSEVVQSQLRVVNTLKATISQIKHIEAGETIGYSRKGKAIQAMRIATISLGYADGLLRGAGNGKFSVLIRGQRAPIVGNVCMDMSMVDITHIPTAQEGDEVIVFGHEPSVEELATCLGTIPYEVFTGVSQRVKRVYVQE